MPKKAPRERGLGGGADKARLGLGAKIKLASSTNTTGSALFRRSSKEKSRPESVCARPNFRLEQPLTRVHPHCLGSVCPVIAFRSSSINS
jgi:hypothetical protein